LPGTTQAILALESKRFFEKLGALIEKRWRGRDFDDASFAQVALGALHELPPAEHVDYGEIVRWAMSADRLPPQNLDQKFGEPPVKLYDGDLFFIEALFWLDVHTDIHQHGFSGAFHVLEGSSLHCRYEFELKDRINTRFLIGNLHLKSVECLMKGDSLSIEAGRGFIHATIHLERPTITIIVRTPADEEALPQYSYLPPFVAYNPFAKRELMTRQIELLRVLHEVRHPDYLRYMRGLVSQPDFERAFFALEKSHRHLQRDDFARLLERAQEQHGRRTKVLLPVVQEMRRTEKFVDRCRFVTKPKHLLLLSLLLYLPDRETILRFIRRHFEGDPVERVIKWFKEMATIKADRSSRSNALGLRFDETSLLVLECLLKGKSFAALKKRLKEEYESEDVDAQEPELQTLCKSLQEHDLLKTLLAKNESAPPIELIGRKWASTPKRLAPQAEAATRGIWFQCFLDERPAKLVPRRFRQAMHSRRESSELIINSTFRFQSDGKRPTELRNGNLSGLWTKSFLPGHPLAWIKDPGTAVYTPFWARGELADLLRSFEAGKPAPSDLPKNARDLLEKANILVRPDYYETRKKQWERVCHELRAVFHSRKYVLVRDLLHPLQLDAIRRYYRKLLAAGTLPLGDKTVARRYSLHNEPLAAFFHGQLTDLVNRIAGEPVKPSYVFFAAYQPGAILKPHVDREQCQFSISFLADYTPEPNDISPWPLFVKPKGSRAAATPAHLGIGDGVVYKGCELLHYREALPENHFSTSLFFHYVPQNFQGELG